MASIAHYIAGMGVVCFLIGGFILWPLFWLISGRYFDNTLGFKKVYNPFAKGNILPGFLMRSGQYATMIVFHRGAKHSYDRMVFGEVDFRKQARPIDVITAFTFVVTFYGGISIIAIAAIIHYVRLFIGWL